MKEPTIIKVKRFVTDDGKEFEDPVEAMNHQTQNEIALILNKYGGVGMQHSDITAVCMALDDLVKLKKDLEEIYETFARRNSIYPNLSNKPIR